MCKSCGRAVLIPAESVSSPPPPLAPIDAPWYFSRDERMFGPLALKDLCDLIAVRRLSPVDWVLTPGATDWIAAREVAELFPAPSPAPVIVAPVVVAAPCSSPAPVEPLAILGVQFDSRMHVLAEAHVVPDSSRCVQCGICSYNCPMGIDVRAHARRGRPIHDSRCLTCSECVNRCPRGVLQFEKLSLFSVET